ERTIKELKQKHGITANLERIAFKDSGDQEVIDPREMDHAKTIYEPGLGWMMALASYFKLDRFL
ncbi:hypothetical protein KJ780_04660, partial [Candidatus Micrarchaeota archaeon]|nr:hypothetical protein [Candidatus Micrarchaeota archaeon]